MAPTVAQVNSKLDDVSSKLDKLSGDFKTFTSNQAQLKNLTETLTAKCEQISRMEVEIADLKNKVHVLEGLVDDEDAYVRRDTIIFNGTEIPPASPGEICNNVIREVLRKKLKLNLQESDISVAHRAGKKPAIQGPDRRGIQVRFCRRDIKRQIMLTKRDNSDPNHTLYSNESLTPKRRSILFALRRMKKKFGSIVKGCTSQDGRIYAFTPHPSASIVSSATDTRSGRSTARSKDIKHLINTQEALEKFSLEFLKQPLDSFLDSLEGYQASAAAPQH